MKKFAKMSLVAAVAVAGLTTSASAVSLEEAIKGVDISGQFRYRFNEKNVDGETVAAKTNNETGSDVEVEVTAKVPVNDMVTAVIKIDNANDDADTANTKGNVTIEDYYFQYVNGAVTVLAGQQNIPGRITDGAQGDGLVALYNAGAFTVGAAAFANHNVKDADESASVLSAIAMGNVGPVSLLGQYATVEDIADVYNLKADAKVGPVMVGLEYTDLELDSKAAAALKVKDDDRSTFKAYVSGKYDIVSATLTYAKTGDNGSGSLDNQTTTNTETPAEYLLWNLGTANNADMDLIAIDASVAVTDKISLRAAYAEGEIGSGAGKDVDEILGQVTYKMSKNLTTYVRYSEFDTSAASDSADGQRGRIEVKYSF